MRISLRPSAATALVGASIDTAISPTNARREIPGMSVLQRTLCFLKELIRHVNEKIAAAELLATRRALPETRRIQHGFTAAFRMPRDSAGHLRYRITIWTAS